MDLDDGKSGLPRLLQCLISQWKIASDLRSTRKQKKEGPPERGGTPERCMKETLESYRSGQ